MKSLPQLKKKILTITESSLQTDPRRFCKQCTFGRVSRIVPPGLCYGFESYSNQPSFWFDGALTVFVIQVITPGASKISLLFIRNEIFFFFLIFTGNPGKYFKNKYFHDQERFSIKSYLHIS